MEGISRLIYLTSRLIKVFLKREQFPFQACACFLTGGVRIRFRFYSMKVCF